MTTTQTVPSDTATSDWSQFVRGVGEALCTLNLQELKLFQAQLIDPAKGASVVDSVKAMVDGGDIDADLSFWHDFPLTPASQGMAAVAMLATKSFADANHLFHLIFGS